MDSTNDVYSNDAECYTPYVPGAHRSRSDDRDDRYGGERNAGDDRHGGDRHGGDRYAGDGRFGGDHYANDRYADEPYSREPYGGQASQFAGGSRGGEVSKDDDLDDEVQVTCPHIHSHTRRPT